MKMGIFIFIGSIFLGIADENLLSLTIVRTMGFVNWRIVMYTCGYHVLWSVIWTKHFTWHVSWKNTSFATNNTNKNC